MFCKAESALGNEDRLLGVKKQRAQNGGTNNNHTQLEYDALKIHELCLYFVFSRNVGRDLELLDRDAGRTRIRIG